MARSTARLKRLRKKSEKRISRGLKPARNNKNKRRRRRPKGRLYRKALFSAACEAVPFQNVGETDFQLGLGADCAAVTPAFDFRRSTSFCAFSASGPFGRSLR